MSEFNLYGDGSGNTATGYPKSDNNGSASDASTIPKDGGHLEEGPEEDAELYQIENPKLDKALAMVSERVLRDRTRVKNSEWRFTTWEKEILPVLG
jgi:hypothetical protein